MDLEDIEHFHDSLKSCPKCSSNEGFWLTANRKKSYVQCKHCGAILEICEVFPEPRKKESKGFLARVKL